MDFNFRTVFGGAVVMAIAIASGVCGCEPPEPVAPQPPPCWSFSEENFQLGAASVCLDGGVNQ